MINDPFSVSLVIEYPEGTLFFAALLLLIHLIEERRGWSLISVELVAAKGWHEALEVGNLRENSKSAFVANVYSNIGIEELGISEMFGPG